MLYLKYCYLSALFYFRSCKRIVSKKLKTFKQESKIGKTEIITDCIIVLFTDLFLGTVFVCILLLILNNYI